MSDDWPRNEHMNNVWQKALNVLKPSKAQLEHGLELHRQSIVCDSFGFQPKAWTQQLVDDMNAMVENSVGRKEYQRKSTIMRIHYMATEEEGAREFVTALKASGVTCLVQTVGGGGAVEGTLPNMAAHAHVYRALRKHMFQAGSSDEIREAKSGDRTAAMWSVNGPPGLGAEGDIDAKLEALETWYHLGVRLMHLSYNRRNMVADGCTEPANGGLSEFGREFVRKMNEVGLIVDTPHSGKQTTLDAAAVSGKPVMASHVGVEGVFPGHPRCKSDEELKAIAGTGGLIGIYAVPSLLGPDADVALMLDHLDYAAKLIGVDHVSIGTDICYMRLWPEDLKPYPKKPEDYLRAGGWKKEHMQYASNAHLDGSLAWTNWPLYTVGLVMRGYADDDIRKILGENLMRVLDANRPAHQVAI